MAALCGVFLLAILIIFTSSFHASKAHQNTDSSLTIQLQTGLIVGKREPVPHGKDVDVFLGIPFAQPPIGKLRFKAPQPAKPWKDVLKATDFGPQCARGPVVTHNVPLGNRSEDCLYLDVYKPTSSPKNHQYPVMVWIHGGGFYHGSGSKYDGFVLASHHDVIVVTINYRLGLLGFLHVAGTELKGNYGLLDQVMALRWVKENIHSFGGNPNRVTIFGESAGGASVDLLILSPLAKGLFNNAIVQSGFSMSPFAWSNSKGPLQYAHILEKLKCDKKEDPLSCLQQKSTDEIIESQSPFAYLMLGNYYPIPVVDGEFLPDEPTVLLAQGRFNHPDTIVLGITKDEGDMFLSVIEPDANTPPSKELFQKIFDKTWFVPNGCNELTKQAMLFKYTNHSDPNSPQNLRQSLRYLMGDSFFNAPAISSANAYAKAGINTYLYQFSHRATYSTRSKNMGVPHFDELQFLFGSPWKPNDYVDRAMPYSDVERGLSTMIMRMWTNLAKNGNPGKDKDLVTWPKYSVRDQNYLDIGLEPRVGSHLHADGVAFWNHLVPMLNTVGEAGNKNQKDLREEL